MSTGNGMMTSENVMLLSSLTSLMMLEVLGGLGCYDHSCTVIEMPVQLLGC